MGSPPLRVLFANGDPDTVEAMVRWFALRGHQVGTATSLPESIKAASTGEFDVLVTELDLPGGSGLDLVHAVRDAEVVVFTSHGSVETAVEAMKLGAFDYLTKPCRSDELERRCLKAAEAARLRCARLRGRAAAGMEMVGRSEPMVELARLIERAGPSDMPVLIEGESGTGKELVARALQRSSCRSNAAFVTVNCAALPDQLLESEFFGHEKGAFTGATATKPGLFEMADGGTLFIDEIAELALTLQAKLLRVLEDGSFRRVGSVAERRADVRVMAATNRDLSAEVSAGRFREDLFYRINVVTLCLPPLRNRAGDIPRLVNSFLGRDWQIDAEAQHAVETYRWPGNVRQLKNAIVRAKVFANRNVIRLCDLPTEVAFAACGVRSEPAEDDIESQQRAHVLKVLARERGNKSRTARLLGLDRRSLYRLLERYAEEGVLNGTAAKPR